MSNRSYKYRNTASYDEYIQNKNERKIYENLLKEWWLTLEKTWNKEKK